MQLQLSFWKDTGLISTEFLFMLWQGYTDIEKQKLLDCRGKYGNSDSMPRET